ncbi:hypothetical protein CYMTET_12492 [Cymbomonas tetramitiformis]|uniref:Uncharacterized protein n=1 Tax=Cymbomonas tetramitiformis TaxID=36881 RepID=A0AAE0GKF7_9CHLO|nr:hypothetical protein CYMTET_12492 [Cymbomonas tetramitiformis]
MIDISNEQIIEHLATKFDINTSKQQPRSPMLEGLSIKLPDAKSIDRSIETPVRSIVYSLLWLARTIRPDIYYHVTYLAHFCHTPTAEIMAAAKRILAYVYGTRNYSLTYECDTQQPRLAVYCDADHTGDISDRNSVSSYCILDAGYDICHMLEQRKERQEGNVHVLTEVKTAHKDIMNKFGDMGYTTVGMEVVNAVERKGAEQTRARGGIVTLLGRPYGHVHNHHVELTPHLEGYLLHTVLHLPGNRFVHIVAVYSPPHAFYTYDEVTR